MDNIYVIYRIIYKLYKKKYSYKFKYITVKNNENID